MPDVYTGTDDVSRSPHGERGLKLIVQLNNICLLCRSPHGERGLKLNIDNENIIPYIVALLTESVD